jgi:group I intron endonuclease
MKNLIGIYQIKNIINGKSYIGQSVNIRVRKWSHKRELLKGKHPNSHLQASFNKYGEDAFVFKILKVFDTVNKQELTIWEDHFIKELDTINPDKGFNLVLSDSKSVQEKITVRKINRVKNEEKFSKPDFYRNHPCFQGDGTPDSEKIKEGILKSIEKYLSEGFKISLIKRRASTTLILSKDNKEEKRVSISLDLKTLYVYKTTEPGQQYKPVSKPILEIQVGTSQILNRWESPAELKLVYPEIKYEDLCNRLLINSKKSSSEFYALQGHLFIREEDYNPDFIYETRWQANEKKKPKKSNPQYSQIQELSEGIIIKNRFSGCIFK